MDVGFFYICVHAPHYDNTGVHHEWISRQHIFRTDVHMLWMLLLTCTIQLESTCACLNAALLFVHDRMREF